MGNSWIVEIVETDEFGWTPRLEDMREFKTKLEADRFCNAYNKKRRAGVTNKQFFLTARKPKEKLPLVDFNRVDPPTYSGPDDDDAEI